MDEYILAENNGIQIYKSDIDYYCQEYIDSLPDESMVYKPAVFSGLLLYIYNHCVKQLCIKDKSNRLNFDLLDNIFYNIYIPLCYRYNITPKIITFCANLVMIDNGHISDIYRGVNNFGEKVNRDSEEIVKKWYGICESGLVEKTVENNGIGSMFLLKAKYGYRDNDNVLTIQTQQAQHESAAEISARYASATLPEKPQLDE